MALGDDVARLTREVWRVNLALGLFDQRAGARDAGRLARASGVTVAQLRGWLAGETQPTTSQALAVLDAMSLPAVAPPATVRAGAA